MKKQLKKDDYWVSLSDMMTGLMVIFLFIAISYITVVKNKTSQIENILGGYVKTKQDLHYELKKGFEKDFKAWNIKLDSTLVIHFLDENVLFDKDKSNIKPQFANILDKFLPKYIGILLKKEFRNKIEEVRIEGHTDSDGSYLYNLELSQKRTANVLAYLRQSNFYSKLPKKDKELLDFWITANGFSFGRTLDKSGNFTVVSGKNENQDKSRRVEFRIIPKSEEVLREIIKTK